ncbi:MAG: hypothetical protein GY803_27560 [Chloroflexi bacterium]|nr:hypothetical protein [Chloroflexota bacterium]
MARPRLNKPSKVVRLALSLREGEDDDLIAFFQRIPARGRARAVMTALRQGGVMAATDDLNVEDDEIADALVMMLF